MTVVSCISPTGQFIPSLLVFQIYIYIYIYICVCVCVCVCNKNWWIAHLLVNPRVPLLGVDTERDFHPVVSSFHQTYKPTNEYPVFLVLDGHYSHTRNMEVINLARENHVDIICLLLHSSHKMQHLYKAFTAHLIDNKNVGCHKNAQNRKL